MATPTNPNTTRSETGQRFEAFFREHYRMVYRTAYSLTRSSQDAEDVVQTVFMNVLRRNELKELAENVKGYLYKAALNEALFMIRRRARQRIECDLECVEDVVGCDPTALEAENRERLLEALSKLTPEAAEILRLHYQEGYSHAEIAKMLGRSRAKIAVDLYRARAQLRRWIGRRPGMAVKPDRTLGVFGRISTGGELQ